MADQPRSASSQSPEFEALPEGLFAERYRIERVLGRGGMATVYAAEDVKHRRRVALKILHREYRAALGGERFLREIELTGNLHHPNILPMFDSPRGKGNMRRHCDSAAGPTRSMHMRASLRFTRSGETDTQQIR